MPVSPGVARLRRLAILWNIRDFKQFRITVQPFVRRRGMIVERSELPRKLKMIVWRPFDTTKNDYMMAVPGFSNIEDSFVREWSGNIDTANFRT